MHQVGHNIRSPTYTGHENNSIDNTEVEQVQVIPTEYPVTRNITHLGIRPAGTSSIRQMTAWMSTMYLDSGAARLLGIQGI